MKANVTFTYITIVLLYLNAVFVIVQAKLAFVDQPKSPTLLKFPEDTKISTTLFTLKTAGGTGKLKFSVDPEGYVELQPVSDNSVDILLKRKLKFRTDLYLTFYVDDDTNRISHDYIVDVTDVNDNPPVFSEYDTTIQIKENYFPPNQLLFTLEAADQADNGFNGTRGIIFELQDANLNDTIFKTEAPKPNSDRAIFKLYMNETFDFEKAVMYRLNVTAYDNNKMDVCLAASATIVINVIDVDDNGPVFTKLPSFTKLDENTTPGTPVFQIKAEDGDRNVQDPIKYSITDGNEENAFRIDETTGKVFVVKELDRETMKDTEIILEITAKEENNGHRRSANVTCTILIQDVNDQPPTFETDKYSGNITENSFANTAINLDGFNNIKVTDLDQSKNARFQVSVITYNNLFELVPSGGTSEAYLSLRLKDSAHLDFETLLTNPLIVKIEAVDVNNDTLKQPAVVTVTILDDNDLIPVFGQSSYEASVIENSPLNSVILTVSATDGDTGDFGTAGIRYSIDGKVPFVVDPSNGKISISDDLDREKIPDYAFTVIARDNLDKGKSSSGQVIVKITDDNDNYPKFTQTVYKVAIQENEKEFQTPFYIKAEDADFRDNGTVDYKIIEITSEANIGKLGDGYFDLVDGPEKDVQLIIVDDGKMDYEILCKAVQRKCLLSVVIEAADRGTPSRKTTQTVQVSLIDTNDEIPTFTEKEIKDVVLKETDTGATPVATVSATDLDVTDDFRKITYQFTGGDTQAFRIDPKSGVITVGAQANLDLGFKKTNLFKLSVKASDGVYREDNEICEIHVTIQDVNNKPPYFTQSPYTADILENANVSDILSLQLSTADHDSDHKLQYSFGNIKAYSPDDREFTDKSYVDKLFAIEPDTGTISVTSVLDREIVHKLIVTLIVNDTKTVVGEKTATAPLTIHIKDVNDNKPVFEKAKYEGSVVENSSEGTEIRPPVKATDNDLQQNVTFSLAGDEKRVKISSDGLITVLSPDIDREEFSFFDLTVVATDDGQPPLSSTVVYHVVVIDVNDNVPEFSPDMYEVAIYEDVDNNTHVRTVSATDKDTGTVYYAFDEAEDLGYFRIDEKTGEIFVAKSLDRDAGMTSLKFRVLARDSQTKSVNTLTGTATVIVTLRDVNDNAPVITPIDTCYEVNELLSLPPHVVGEIRGTDPDEGENGRITFSLANNNTNKVKDLFRIEPLGSDGKAANLVVNKSLRDQVQVFEIGVMAKDNGANAKPTKKMETVRVCVVDYNNHSPVINYPPVGTKIGALENLTVRGEVFKINATDDDSDDINTKLVYSIKSDIFYVDDKGVVTLLKKFNRNNIPFYKLKLEVCDSGKPLPLCTFGEANIVVQSIHDKEPYFNNSTQTLKFREETKRGEESKPIIAALDDDNNLEKIPENYTIGEVSMSICYYIVGGSMKTFELGLEDGNLRSLITLDREKTAEYVVYIKATNDCGNTPSMIVDLESPKKNYLNLTIEVVDVNDNPPQFTQKVFGGGIIDNSATSDHVMQLEATDADVGENAQVAFYIDSDITVDKGENIAAGEDKNKWFSLNKETGVLSSNYQFDETMKGYVKFQVKVNNTKDLESSRSNRTYDTAEVKIYILRNDQKSTFIFRKTVAEFFKIREAFALKLSSLTNVTAYINAIKPYIDKNKNIVIKEWSSVSVHYVDENHNVIDPAALERNLDKDYKAMSQLANEFGVKEVESKGVAGKSSLDAHLTSVYAASGALILLLTAFLSLYCNRVSKLKLQLKASNLSTYSQANRKQSMAPELPTTNLHTKAASNPIYNIDEETFKESQDTLSIASEGSLVNNQTDFEGGENNRGFVGALENYFGTEPAIIDTNYESNDQSVML